MPDSSTLETQAETPASPETPAGALPPADAASELASLKAKLADTAAQVLTGVPEHLRGLIPVSLSPADQIDWFNTAKATGIFDKPAVPAVPAMTPAITPAAPDTSGLPVHARMAAGYAK